MVNTKLDLGLLHTANNLVLTDASPILPPQERSLHIPATYNFQILSNYENQNRTPLEKKKNGELADYMFMSTYKKHRNVQPQLTRKITCDQTIL